ncbi:MAG TPA: membrane protein insertase YidC [Acidimicrobiales bacterium]|nr:membrane protein insertase YidC [Acidimicrobiales bacterium]
MFQLLANLLAWFYSIIPNYAVAIALLTITVMLVLSPLTLKSTRSMLAMQKLQPEMKALQAKYKGGDREQLNKEMMALYKEHNVNPVAGCLPLLIQMPVFIVMYRVIKGLTATPPKYISSSSALYQALVKSNGQMNALGMDLSQSAREHHGSFAAALPYYILVALVVFTQYWQTRQTMARNTRSSNPQQQMMLTVMPGFFGLISLSIPAGVNIYFLTSALFRIGQTSAMYRFDPTLKAHVESRAKELEAKAEEITPPKGGKGQPPPKGGKVPPAKGKAQPPPKGAKPGTNGSKPPPPVPQRSARPQPKKRKKR